MGRLRRSTSKTTIGISAAALAALVASVLPSSPAAAHGAMMMPGSRTYLCWKDGLTPQGNIVPNNPACAAAVAQSGTNALYNWFAVLRSDGAGRTRGFIPDGKLCSADARVYDFSGFDLARDDWPVTHLTAGATIQIRYNMWAHHPGTFRLYVTKDSWSPNRPLTWDDLESTPFSEVTDPPSVGSPGNENAYYYWNARLPANKSGRHIIYSIWQRSDSQETFYNCSDVVFDGGNGEVTGIGPGSGGPSTPPSSPPASPPASPSPSPSVSPPPSSERQCTATYRVVNSWSGGFQGEVTVHNPGDTALSGWAVSWRPASGQSITQVWNGRLSESNGTVTVRNESYNGNLAAHASTTFGFLANGPGDETPSVSCEAS